MKRKTDAKDTASGDRGGDVSARHNLHIVSASHKPGLVHSSRVTGRCRGDRGQNFAGGGFIVPHTVAGRADNR